MYSNQILGHRIHSWFEESTLKFGYFCVDRRTVNSASDNKFSASGNFLRIGMMANSSLSKARQWVKYLNKCSTNILLKLKNLSLNEFLIRSSGTDSKTIYFILLKKLSRKWSGVGAEWLKYLLKLGTWDIKVDNQWMYSD